MHDPAVAAEQLASYCCGLPHATAEVAVMARGEEPSTVEQTLQVGAVGLLNCLAHLAHAAVGSASLHAAAICSALQDCCCMYSSASARASGLPCSWGTWRACLGCTMPCRPVDPPPVILLATQPVPPPLRPAPAPPRPQQVEGYPAMDCVALLQRTVYTRRVLTVMQSGILSDPVETGEKLLEAMAGVLDKLKQVGGRAGRVACHVGACAAAARMAAAAGEVGQ